jgi:hypothetical protein
MLIAMLMALVFGLFSMPSLQAAPSNGSAVGSALKSVSPLKQIRWRRRRRCHHHRRSRRRCWWW